MFLPLIIPMKTMQGPNVEIAPVGIKLQLLKHGDDIILC